MTTTKQQIEDLEGQGFRVRVRHHRIVKDKFGGNSCVSMYDIRRLKLMIQPRGGRTVVSIENEEAGILGHADCSIKDNYDKRMGVTIALGRALKNLAAK